MPDTAVTYIEFTEPQADAFYGKIAKGDIRAMPPEQALRFKTIGVAKDSSESAYNKAREDRAKTAEDTAGRRLDYDRLNRADDWDTSTTRDVTMASDEGIKRAHKQGRLVNTAMLRDEDGNILPNDASLEEILEARQRLGFAESPLTAHERSSVQGGGSHTRPGFADKPQVFDTLHGKAPLNARSQDLSPAQVGNSAGEPEKESEDAGAEGKSAKGRTAKK